MKRQSGGNDKYKFLHAHNKEFFNECVMRKSDTNYGGNGEYLDCSSIKIPLISFINKFPEIVKKYGNEKVIIIDNNNKQISKNFNLLKIGNEIKSKSGNSVIGFDVTLNEHKMLNYKENNYVYGPPENTINWVQL